MGDTTGERETTDLWRVFVSYADEDSMTVGPIVRVLRAAFSEPDGVAFWSRDSIPGGQEWAKYLGAAIAASRRLFVFWCEHSRKSKWVKWEYSLALRLRRPIVPILLSDEVLTEDLSVFQAVDLRALQTHNTAPSRMLRRGPDYMEPDLNALYGGVIVERFRPFLEQRCK
ncbi:MAG TPA: toll/interleukin-1 receptor domain-containing protein [Candidatus Binatia bacterium]|jgi:hypothetical protein|nr:toll/interleukin-1 receptor domain-containing protein [Candidatus Binatia bacterium]